MGKNWEPDGSFSNAKSGEDRRTQADLSVPIDSRLPRKTDRLNW